MSQLQIGKGFRLPAEAVTQTFGILAIRGAGKTYTAAVLAEELVKAGQQVVIVDPVGVWWGLLVDENLCAVIDLSHMRKGEQATFMPASTSSAPTFPRRPPPPRRCSSCGAGSARQHVLPVTHLR